MRILALTIGAPTAGSTRFRIIQYSSVFAEKGIELETIEASDLNDSVLNKIASVDLVINQKCILNSSWAKRIRQAARRLVFDFDDAIYTRPGKPYSFFTRWRVNHRLKKWFGSADLVITANEFLKNYAQPKAKHIEVIPMAIDLAFFSPDSRPKSKTVTIGWAGAPNNLHHIERLDGILQGVISKFPQVKLAIFSGAKPRLKCPHTYVNFTPDGEAHFIQQLDIGLLPLADEEYSRGKSPIKALQYLGCGVPVVGNVYGATSEILTPLNSIAVHEDEEWEEALAELITNRPRCSLLGQAGREFVSSHHSKEKVGAQLCEALLAL